MGWPCFLNILHLIEPDPIFYKQSWNHQQDVSIQLAIATCCLGSNGNGAAVLRLKNLFQFGYGTSNLYTTRPPIDGNHYYDHKKRSGVTNSSVISNSFQDSSRGTGE
ncbi:uncharacterized protein VP01_1299g3 [Puccinia sorghi]|uniref:Uncharacterized protein n=1 Tax=Puccinia sorghi TaxID=27349 RepID=A0A0L6VNN6_9BASI|nr:uncharacterized protein VP01_1299g3 [Puccinia sorghi]